MSFYECNCKVCNNDDLPRDSEEHETCACYYCHENGYHVSVFDWDGGCGECADEVKKAFEQIDRE